MVKARKCPIVAVTAFDLESISKTAEEVGIKRVISKPVDIEQMRSVIKSFYFN